MEVSLSPKEHDAHEWLPLEEAKDKLVWAEQRSIVVWKNWTSNKMEKPGKI